MRRLIKRFILLCLVFLIICSSITVIVNADTQKVDTSKFDGKENPIPNLTTNTTDTVIGVVRVVCVTIAIVMLLVIAAKYMISAPGDRADIKKHAVAYVIGAVILFGSSAILGVLVDVANQVEP